LFRWVRSLKTCTLLVVNSDKMLTVGFNLTSKKIVSYKVFFKKQIDDQYIGAWNG